MLAALLSLPLFFPPLLDMNTCHPVLTGRLDSPARQAIFIFIDARFISEIMVQVRGVLLRGQTSRLPGHNEVRYISGGLAPPSLRKVKATMNSRAPVVCLVTGQRRAGSGTDLPPNRRAQLSEIYSRRCCLPPRKAKATMNCREPLACLVKVPVSCLDTASVPGRETPPDTSPRARPLVLGHILCLVLGHSSRAGGGTPSKSPPLEHAPWCWVTEFVSCLDTAAPPGPSPRARPLVLGHRFCLVLGHSSRAGRGNPPRTPLEHTPWCWVTDFISCLDTAAVPGTPPKTPPRAHPWVLGHRFCLVLGHSSRAGKPLSDPPPSTPLGAGSQILSRAWTQQPCRETPPRTPRRARPLVLGYRFIYIFF